MDWLKDWAMRFWADFLEVLSGRPALELLHKLSAFFIGLWRGLDWHGVKGLISLAVEEINDGVVNFADVFTSLAASTINQIAGLGLDPKKIGDIMNKPPGREPAVELGSAFLPLVDNIFNIAAAAADNKTRNTYEGARNNIRAYFGTNLLFQLRSLTIGSLAAFFPYFDLSHLKSLHESINWAFGMGWLSWSVMSAVMDATTTLRLKQYYLSQVLPNDYSEAEARWAYWAGRLSPGELELVLSNQGARKDIRQPLLDRAEADLTEADLVDFWQHQRLPEADILKQYRLKGFGETKATLKKDRVVDARLWDVLDKINGKYGQLYRDCVVDKIEYQQWLQGRGYSANEQDAEVAFWELDRRARKWLEKSDLDKLLDAGVLSVAEVTDYLICQGMTELDAAMQVLLFMAPKIPKAKLDKCAGKSIDDLLADLLAYLLRFGGITVPGGLLAWLKCLLEGKLPFEPEPEITVQPPSAKLPTGGISTLPSTLTVGEQYRLVWHTDNSDRQEIDNDIGPVGPQGTLFLTADKNRIYHLTARNEAGIKEFQASILVRPKAAPGPVKVSAPTISFSVSPPRAIVGDQIAIQWETHNASQAFLDDGLGLKAVALSGARFGVADQSRVYTLTAAGLGGQRQRSDTIVVRPTPEERVPVPVVHLSVSPSRAHIGDEVEVKWSTANASLVYLEGLTGREQVSSSGIRIVKADVDKVITLRATNPEAGTERIAQDALIVEKPPTPGDIPEPEPVVALTLRPSKAKRGDKVAIEWRTVHADRVTIEIAGTVVTVEPVGGDTFTAHETDTVILHAYGKNEERTIAKVVVVE